MFLKTRETTIYSFLKRKGFYWINFSTSCLIQSDCFGLIPEQSKRWLKSRPDTVFVCVWCVCVCVMCVVCVVCVCVVCVCVVCVCVVCVCVCVCVCVVCVWCACRILSMQY